MRTVGRTESVPYSAAQMFDLVNDIESYPAFLHWCQDAAVERSDATEVVATLDVGLGGIRKQFTTRNTLQRPERISIELVKGPFRSLSGRWDFEDKGSDGCVVGLRLEFEVAHTPLDMMFAALFEEIVRSQVAAFVKRAETRYD